MAAPVLIGYYEPSSNWTSVADATSRVTSSFSVLANDCLVVIGVSEIGTRGVDGPPVGGSLTWTQVEDPTPTSGESQDCDIKAWTAIVDSGKSMTVTLVSTGDDATARAWGFSVAHYRSSDGFGAAESTISLTGGPTLAITTTAANSAVVVGIGDYNAIDGASRTWRTASVTPSAGNGLEKTYFRSSVAYTVYVAGYNDVGAAGAKTVGVSAPTGQRYGIVAIEVKGSSGASVSTTLTGLSLTTAVRDPVVNALGNASVTGLGVTASVGTVITQSTNGYSIETGNLYQIFASIGPLQVATIDTTAAFAATQPSQYLDWVVVGVNASSTLTGFDIAAGLGTVTVGAAGNISVSPTGQALAAAVGTATVTTTQNVSVTGLQLTISGGGGISVTAGGNIATSLTGQSLTASVDTVSAGSTVNMAVTGQQLLVEVGSVDAVGGVPISVSVTGQELTASVGDVDATNTIPVTVEVTGLELTVSVGSVTTKYAYRVSAVGLTISAAVGQIYCTAWGPAVDDQPAEIWTEVSHVA